MTVTINGTTGIAGVDGSAGTPAVQGGDNNTGMFFPAADTIAFAEGGTEVMRIDSSGNVGIGTSSPAYKLDVNGGINSQTGFVYLGNANVYANYRSGNNDVIYSGASGFFYYQNITSTYHAWYTGNSERARIDSSGNLLVGTTSHFDSAYTMALQVRNATGGLVIRPGSDGYTAISFRNAANTQVGRVDVSSSATSYATSSDYRLKEDVQPMTGALAKVAALKPVTYKWKSTGEASEGFIAHELAQVCPDAVSGEKDAVNEDGSIKPQGIDTSFLVATLTAAIQELKGIVDSQAARIAALEGAAQ